MIGKDEEVELPELNKILTKCMTGESKRPLWPYLTELTGDARLEFLRLKCKWSARASRLSTYNSQRHSRSASSPYEEEEEEEESPRAQCSCISGAEIRDAHHPSMKMLRATMDEPVC